MAIVGRKASNAICGPFIAFCKELAGGAAISSTWLLIWAGLAAQAHWVLAVGAADIEFPHPMVVLAVLAIVTGIPRMPLVPPTRADWALFALALFACMPPFRTAASLALGCAAAIAWRGHGPAARSVSVLLLALAGWGMKDGVWVGFVSVPVMAAEAHVVSFLLNLGGLPSEATGNHIEFPDGQGFIILRACSLLSLAYPCAVAVYALFCLVHPNRQPGLLRIALALAILAVLNNVRLVSMAASPAIYDYLHGETGDLPLQLAWSGIVMIAALPQRRAA